jgi:predicted small metal-binding protein
VVDEANAEWVSCSSIGWQSGWQTLQQSKQFSAKMSKISHQTIETIKSNRQTALQNKQTPLKSRLVAIEQNTAKALFNFSCQLNLCCCDNNTQTCNKMPM